jgi:serine/threonine protein kinase
MLKLAQPDPRTMTTCRFDVDSTPCSLRSGGTERFTVGRYDATALIAHGGMSAVYLGEELATGKGVALKILEPCFARHEDLVRRFLSELEVSRRVRHQGLVRIYDGSRTPDGIPYLAIELLDGECLGATSERGPVDLGAIAAIGAQIADALAAMHAAKVAHCDLKPENIMVLHDGSFAGWPRIKVVDFGVARFLDREEDEGQVAGTPMYMAPEQWRGHADERSDIYALGCMLYELVAGRCPFEGSVAELVAAHADILPPPLASFRALPRDMERLIHRMLSKDPGMRPRSMAEVARAFTDLAFAMPPGARPMVELEQMAG